MLQVKVGDTQFLPSYCPRYPFPVLASREGKMSAFSQDSKSEVQGNAKRVFENACTVRQD